MTTTQLYLRLLVQLHQICSETLLTTYLLDVLFSNMAEAHNVDNCARFHVFRDPALEDKCAHIKTYKYYFVHRRAAGATNGVTTPHYSPQPPP